MKNARRGGFALWVRRHWDERTGRKTGDSPLYPRGGEGERAFRSNDCALGQSGQSPIFRRLWCFRGMRTRRRRGDRMIPSSRMIWVVGLVGFPAATLAALWPEGRVAGIVCVGLVAAVIFLDALMRARALDRVRVELPGLVRIFKDRAAEIRVRVHRGSGSRVRIGVVVPEGIAADSEETDVDLPQRRFRSLSGRGRRTGGGFTGWTRFIWRRFRLSGCGRCGARNRWRWRFALIRICGVRRT